MAKKSEITNPKSEIDKICHNKFDLTLEALAIQFPNTQLKERSTMKNLKRFGYLVIIVMLIGCKPKNSTADNPQDDTSREMSEEWLAMNGDESMPNIVLVSGDEEYRSEEALPQLAKILSKRHDFNCTVLFAQNPEEPGIVKPNYTNNILGLEKLKTAGLMIIFTRFRALPDEQMKHIDDYLKSGKPVIGIRTSTHAFDFKNIDFESNYLHYGNSYKGEDEWEGGFGRLVLGEKWISHHGHHKHQSTKGIAAQGAKGHPILNGIKDGDIWGPSDVYIVRLPLPGDSQPIVSGQVMDREGEFDEDDSLFGMRPSDNNPAKPVIRKNKNGEAAEVDLNDPMMPIAWVKSYQIPGGKKGKAFTSIIGSATDLLAEGTRRMMVNAVYWCLELDVPPKANVDLVGNYEPTKYAFHPDSIWHGRKLQIVDME